jgi:hypothetical protein
MEYVFREQYNEIIDAGLTWAYTSGRNEHINKMPALHPRVSETATTQNVTKTKIGMCDI